MELTDKPKINVIVRDNNTDSALSEFILERGHVDVILQGPNQNISNDINDIEKKIGHKINPLVNDLYKIAIAIYISDLQILRDEIIGQRDIKILISVSNKPKWNSVKEHLEATLCMLSGDNFTFHFVQDSNQNPEEFKNIISSENVISLFSGGLDSLSGAKWLFESGKNPIFVSHYSSKIISHAQAELIKDIRNIYGLGISHYHIYICGRGEDLQQKERSQKSRSFLFLSLGSVIALELGVKEIYICENGVLALNIPVSESRIFNNTKTAHPKFIKMYNQLLQRVFGTELKVINPFLTFSKGEVVKILDDGKFHSMIKKTTTCSVTGGLRWKGVKTSQISHCGICLPCILRRASLYYANLSGYDANYATTLTEDYPKIPKDGKKILFEIIDFGNRLESLTTDDEVLQEIFDFYIDEDIDPSPLIKVYRTFITEIKKFMRDNCSTSIKSQLGL